MSDWAIGIDIGGTKIAAGVVDGCTGEVGYWSTQPTHPERGGQAVIDDCLAIARLLADWIAVAAPGSGPVSIGIGVPELVDRKGRVQSAFQFDWMDLPVQGAFAGLGPVTIESDVRAAALAEARFGSARDAGSALYVSAGTGISSCFLIDGRPWTGANGNALVMATGPTMVIDPATGDPISQALEDIASGPALARRYRLAAGETVTGAEEVLRRAAAGDLLATHVTTTGAAMLGNAIGHLVNVLDPEIVVIGGGLGLAGGQIWSSMVDSARLAIWSDVSRRVPIRMSELGGQAGVIGAALAALAALAATSEARSRRAEGAMR